MFNQFFDAETRLLEDSPESLEFPDLFPMNRDGDSF